MKTIAQLVESCQEKFNLLTEMISIKDYTHRLMEIDDRAGRPNFWDDQKAASLVMKERQKVSDMLERMTYFKEQTSFYVESLESMPDELKGMEDSLVSLEKELADFEFKQMFKEPVDDSPAILSISAGAGGLEAANWVSMLLRMYARYAASVGFKLEFLDMKPSEEHSAICIDSVTVRVEGPFAFGFLKGEAGVHRLIRNSPFNSGDARHTSFAAVAVTPDIEDTIEIKIEEKDLEITGIRAGGPGGQSVNKTSSAIRLKHIPTGIQIVVRTERDQHANRKTAMKMLRSKLYQIELDKKEAEQNKYLATMQDNAFGSQIRTFTLTPYQLVKDERTGTSNNNADKVLDGDLQNFIYSYLRSKK